MLTTDSPALVEPHLHHPGGPAVGCYWVLEAIPGAAVVLDGSGCLTYVNRQAQNLFGYGSKDLLGRPIQVLFAERFRDAYGLQFRKFKEEKTVTELACVIDLWGRKRDGQEFQIDIRLNRLKFHGEVVFLGIIQDMSARRRYEEQLTQQSQELQEANLKLQELATHDALTGLTNMRAFRERLEDEYRRAARHQVPLSLLMIDIDHFKVHNDTLGHPAGDRILVTLAQIVGENARETDLVARYGGEEFVVLLPFTGHAGATVLAERFRQAIENGDWNGLRVTASVGAATVEAGGDFGKEDGSELIAAADRALYHAKSHGRNRSTHASQLEAAPIAIQKGRRFRNAPKNPAVSPLAHPLTFGRAWLSRAIRDENIFLFLLGIRWLSLLPPLLALFLSSPPSLVAQAVFGAALLANLILTGFQVRINTAVLNHPALLLADMMLAATFIACTGGTGSPYGFYASVPLFAAAFMFQIRGGLTAATVFSPLYVGAVMLSHRYSGSGTIDAQSLLVNLLNFYWLSLIFGYPSLLLRRLRTATEELHRAQQEAARAETLAALGKMAAHVSHEIRNPLSTIGGFAASVLRHPEDVARVQKNVGIVADEVKRLEQLLTDILDLARQPALSLRTENLHNVLDKAWLLANPPRKEKAVVQVRKNYDPALPPIQADASALLRAFLNVMQNAVQMMPDGGSVTIETKTDGEGNVLVSICDTGPGIAPDILPTLFTPFVTHRPHGTGLGLSVTQRIVQQHGGSVEAKSSPGQGACFIFRFPGQAHSSAQSKEK